MDCNFFIQRLKSSSSQVFAILAHIPRTSNGKMRIDEFINLPILSEEAFNAIDRWLILLAWSLSSKCIFQKRGITRNRVATYYFRNQECGAFSNTCFLLRNKDGFLTMGEIKLVNKNATKNEIKVILLKIQQNYFFGHKVTQLKIQQNHFFGQS